MRKTEAGDIENPDKDQRGDRARTETIREEEDTGIREEVEN
jgi:hypothetical protein